MPNGSASSAARVDYSSVFKVEEIDADEGVESDPVSKTGKLALGVYCREANSFPIYHSPHIVELNQGGNTDWKISV